MNAKLAATLVFTFIASTAWADCDPEAARKAFNRCTACHSVEPGEHLMGPSLHGVMGGKAGTAEGFSYSAALAEADIVWNDETMSAFLENPMQYLPGTTMPFAGLRKESQRHDIICYLEANSGAQ
jgi:cytochrome c